MTEPKDFLPTPPDKGPPLPRGFGVKWPKGESKNVIGPKEVTVLVLLTLALSALGGWLVAKGR